MPVARSGRLWRVIFAVLLVTVVAVYFRNARELASVAHLSRRTRVDHSSAAHGRPLSRHDCGGHSGTRGNRRIERNLRSDSVRDDSPRPDGSRNEPHSRADLGTVESNGKVDGARRSRTLAALSEDSRSTDPRVDSRCLCRLASAFLIDTP